VSDDLDSFEAEGIQAFTRLAGAVQDLNGRLGAFEHGLGTKVASAEQAASKAETAALDAKHAAGEAHAAARADARSLTAWTAFLVAVSILIAGGLGYALGERAGQATGHAAGYQDAHDEKAAASWANTPSGKLAFAMDQLGSLAMVAACNNKGWQVEKRQGSRICFPQPLLDGTPHGTVYGWTLP
jgi:hypothetical protein